MTYQVRCRTLNIFLTVVTILTTVLLSEHVERLYRPSFDAQCAREYCSQDMCALLEAGLSCQRTCREVKLLDNTIKSLENQGDTLNMVAPVGAPKKHWWWWLQ